MKARSVLFKALMEQHLEMCSCKTYAESVIVEQSAVGTGMRSFWVQGKGELMNWSMNLALWGEIQKKVVSVLFPFDRNVCRFKFTPNMTYFMKTNSFTTTGLVDFFSRADVASDSSLGEQLPTDVC